MTKKKQSLFEKLLENKTCFAIVVEFVKLKIEGFERTGWEYTLIIRREDLSHFPRGLFTKAPDYKNVFEHTMTNGDLLEFKEHSEKFHKVHRDEYGKVYELKGNSFKKYHDSLKVKKANSSYL